MQIAVLGIDLGKNSCSVVGLDATGRVVLRRRMHRDSVIKLAAGLPSCIMAVEAYCGAHHLGRLLRDQGHRPVTCPRAARPTIPGPTSCSIFPGTTTLAPFLSRRSTRSWA